MHSFRIICMELVVKRNLAGLFTHQSLQRNRVGQGSLMKLYAVADT